MLLTISLVLGGLSTGHQIGLATVGFCFIAFALISSFVLPRRDPNFPGKNMPVYIAVSVVFFIAMISAVLIFGQESKKAAAAPATHGDAQYRRRHADLRPPQRRRPATRSRAKPSSSRPAARAVTR